MKKFTLICTILVSGFSFFINDGYAQADVLMQHNDHAGTGWNNQETILNTSNVNANSFGLLYSRTVDDQMYAQPLIVSGVNIPSAGTKNIVYACTVNNTIYAFDADDSTAPVYWQVNYTPSGYRAPTANDMHPGLCGGYYHDFAGNIGIIGTPVIDKSSNTMYFVTKIVSTAPGVEDNHPWDGNEYGYTNTGFYQYLHAVDLSTGAEKPGSPVKITATYSGPGDGNVSGVMTFDPRRQFNRTGLVLSHGIVYIAFAAHCDWDPYHGWMLGYSAASLQQKVVYMTTPNDGRGGIWMSGAAPAVDSLGNIYFAVGNGFDDGTTYTDSPTDSANRGESIVKLTPNALDTTVSSLKVSSFFTPRYYLQYNDGDLDFPIQTLLIPNSNMLLTGCKDNSLYLLDKTSLGGFDPNTNNILQQPSMGLNADMHSSFAYFGGPSTHYVYQFSENTLLQSFIVGSNSITNPVSSSVSGPTGVSGAYMSVSSNGTDPSSAILWVSHAVNGCNANQQLCPGVLRAIRADDVTTELWNSTMSSADNVGNFAKMSCPSIANGKVYLNTFSNQLAVYGLKTNNTCNTYPNVASSVNNSTASYSASSTISGSNPNNAFDGITSTSWISESSAATGGGDTGNISVNLGNRYDICKVIIYWGSNYGTSFNIEGSNDGINYTIISSVTNNSSANSIITFSTASYQYIKMAGVARESTSNGYVINEMEVYGKLSNPCSTPTGLSATNLTQNTATLNWQAVTGATSYNIQYKTSLVSSWITRTSSFNSINIDALTCGTGYTFEVQAVCASGTSAPATGVFTTSTCTATCGPLPTRYFSVDIGDIGVAGSTCLSNGIYTLNGSGSDIGGNSDQFHYAFTNLSGDEHIVAQVLTQDASNPFNKVGLMLRDSVSDTSPFAFISVTSGNGIFFEYRSTSGGPTSAVTVPGITAPYWLELYKTGTQYTAYISPTGAANSWVQVGSTVDLGFGTSTVYVGMAIASDNNSILSTATIANYAEVPIALPLGLLSFTGTNINNQYVLLKWADSHIGTKYYSVQSSINGTDYKKIGEVTAGSNYNTQTYSAYDYHPNNGINYYRLEEVNNDSTVSYSNIIIVDFGNKKEPQVYPNPVNSYVTVAAGAEAMNDITIFDVSGKTVMHEINTNNSSTITIPMENLATGIYVIKITTASNVYQQKIIKQ